MRIQGITIPDDKHLEISLTELYGVGRSRAKEVLDNAGIDYDATAGDLSEEDDKKLRSALDEYQLEGDLKRRVSDDIKRLKDIDSYRGDRHTKNLPLTNRTRTNARTVPEGIRAKHRDRKTAGSGRTKVEKK